MKKEIEDEKDNPNSKEFDPYRRGKSILNEYYRTKRVYYESSKMSFIDFFVYRWYKNYVEPRFDIKKQWMKKQDYI